MEKKGKILVLDDNHVVALSCKRILGAEGYNIITVERGTEAIKRLGSEEFDLLISDIMLPDINGMTVVRQSRIIQPKLDIVIITGYPNVNDAKEAVKLGVYEYIEKPFTPDFIINVAKKIFAKRGWILRQSFIDEFRNIPTSNEKDHVIFYKEGIWVRPTKDGLWEAGCDVRYWLLTDVLRIDLPKGLSSLVAGEPFAMVLGGKGETHELIAPMSGVVKEINHQVNEDMGVLIRDNLRGGWLLWLARIQPSSMV